MILTPGVSHLQSLILSGRLSRRPRADRESLRIMKDITNFILAVFCVKLIEDNLPNLHYKNLRKGFDKYIAPLILLACILWLSFIVKITKNEEQKKLLFTLTVLAVAGIMITKAIEQKKKQFAS